MPGKQNKTLPVDLEDYHFANGNVWCKTIRKRTYHNAAGNFLVLSHVVMDFPPQFLKNSKTAHFKFASQDRIRLSSSDSF